MAGRWPVVVPCCLTVERPAVVTIGVVIVRTVTAASVIRSELSVKTSRTCDLERRGIGEISPPRQGQGAATISPRSIAAGFWESHVSWPDDCHESLAKWGVREAWEGAGWGGLGGLICCASHGMFDTTPPETLDSSCFQLYRSDAGGTRCGVGLGGWRLVGQWDGCGRC